MNRKIKLGFLIVALVLVSTAVPVFAAPPLDVHIEVFEIITSDGESFTASGPAVDSGLVCASGTVTDESVKISGQPKGKFLILHITKRFSCEDSSGTFDIKLVVRLDLITNETTANWKVWDGTGDYANLHGNGKLIGIPQDPGISILDIYDGRMH